MREASPPRVRGSGTPTDTGVCSPLAETVPRGEEMWQNEVSCQGGSVAKTRAVASGCGYVPGPTRAHTGHFGSR